MRKKPEPLAVPEAINEVRFMDFMHDQLSDGRSYRLFNMIDDYNREGLNTVLHKIYAASGINVLPHHLCTFLILKALSKERNLAHK